ncbi:MAG: glycosyltransferase [Thermoplasmata archaeon]|nr:glycosyltransferase [Thermoplasmata archaeon]
MKTIGAVMIVKNEEKCLAKCLESLHELDEIVILDTGSTDKTGEVARRFTDHYIEGAYKWDDNFAEARGEAAKYASADWTLILDADEWLVPGSAAIIKDAIQDTDIRVFDIVAESERTHGKHQQPRLYVRSPDIFWKGRIHNYLNVRGTKLLDGVTVMYGYSPAHKDDPDRALRILTNELDKNPLLKREKLYLAREYMYRKNWDEALKWYSTFLSNATWAPEIAEAHYNVALCHKQSGHWQKARDACMKAIGVNPDFKRALILMGDLSFPDNKEKWHRLATVAQNKGVLFG